MGKRKRRVFTAEQRAEAVKIAVGSRKPIAQVARDLDLTVSVLRLWIKQAKVEWIEIFYNGKRRHSSLDYLTPLEHERRYYENLDLPEVA